jgi:hypothetical protein
MAGWMRGALLALALAVVPAGAHAHEGEDHGAPKPVAAQQGGAAVGLIGERYEVLVKGPAPLPGQPWEAHVFVADARTNAPLPGLPVQLGFLGAGEVQARAAATPQPGVYEATLTLPKAGAWEVLATVGAGQGAEVLALGTLQVSVPEAADHGEPHAEGTALRTVGLVGAGLGLAALLLLARRVVRARRRTEVSHG